MNHAASRTLLYAANRRSKARGVPYTRYIWELMERDVTPSR
jgi:predicted DNA binding CopG/RHH family protein